MTVRHCTLLDYQLQNNLCRLTVPRTAAPASILCEFSLTDARARRPTQTTPPLTRELA